MKNEKLKAIFKLSLVASIPLYAIVYFAFDKIQSNKLHNHGIKTTAIVQKKEKTRELNGRGLRMKDAYYITIEYQDYNNIRYTKKFRVNNSEYGKRGKGDSVEVLYNKEEPRIVVLIDYRKYKNTQERTLRFDDLIDFQKNNNTKYILDKLNQIAYGWEVKKDDSTFFLNKVRKSYLVMYKDSSKYFANWRHSEDISDYIDKIVFPEREEIRIGNLDNPFDNLTKPEEGLYFKTLAKIKEVEGFTIRYNHEIDFKMKAWYVLSCYK